MEEGEKRIIISFRAIGEGHISSIVFRRAILDAEASIHLLPAGNYVDEAEKISNTVYHKKTFFETACACETDTRIVAEIEGQLNEDFDYVTLQNVVLTAQASQPDSALKSEYDKLLRLADAYYDLAFSLDTNLSDRVIFPFAEFESKVGLSYKNGQVVVSPTFVVATLQNHDDRSLPGQNYHLFSTH